MKLSEAYNILTQVIGRKDLTFNYEDWDKIRTSMIVLGQHISRFLEQNPEDVDTSGSDGVSGAQVPTRSQRVPKDPNKSSSGSDGVAGRL